MHWKVLATLNIAIARFRVLRDNAKRDQLVVFCKRNSRLNSHVKIIHFGDQMVRCQHQKHTLFVSLSSKMSG